MAHSFARFVCNKQPRLFRLAVNNRNFILSDNLNYCFKWRQSLNDSAVSLQNLKISQNYTNVLEQKQFHTDTRLNNTTGFFFDKEVFKRTQEEAKKCEFPVRYLEFSACQNLYASLIAIGEDRPAKGVKLNVAYIDTDPHADKHTPIIVCLHGVPGGHWDFNDIIAHFHRKGFRVIAINFPGYGWTHLDEDTEFTSSPEEKAVLVQEFLQELGIEKVDLGIVHSAAVYPGYVLSSEDLNVFKSMAMINPGGMDYQKILRPFWYLKFHSRFYRNPILRPLLLSIMKIMLIAMNFGNKNPYEMSVAVESLTTVPYEEYKDYARAMNLRGFPTCVMYSLKDNAVEASSSEELMKLLGTQGIRTYDGYGQLKTSSHKLEEVRSWGHVFDRGGHFLMKKYPREINNIIEEFSDSFLKKNLVCK